MTTFAYILLAVIAFVALIVIIARRWSVPCQVWLRWLVELDNPFSKTNRAATIIERLHLQPGMAVLDVGCGPGRLAVPIALTSASKAPSWRWISSPACSGAPRKRHARQTSRIFDFSRPERETANSAAISSSGRCW